VRRCFVQTLGALAETDPRVVLLTGDLGYTVVEPFANRFPDRFFNTGVAEQNMVGLATGLAEAGFLPFVYSIATFAVLRPFEFIRNGPVLHRLPVRIVGVGGGFEYGAAGPTHHALEDIALLRTQPGMTIVCPADYQQAAEALRQTWLLPGPVYYRLGKDETSVVPGLDGAFSLHTPMLVRHGDDLVLIAIGPEARAAVSAAESLASENISAAVYVVPVVHPAPDEQLKAVLANYPLVVTIEAHYAIGGLGSLVAETIARHRLHCALRVCAVEAPSRETGSETYLLDRHGLSPDAVRVAARDAVRHSGRLR
jgi:transketolase